MGDAVGLLSIEGGWLLLSLFLKASLILGVAWLLAALTRRSSAAVRHGIWVTALFSIAALPLATYVLPPLRIELPAALLSIPSPADVDALALSAAAATGGMAAGSVTMGSGPGAMSGFLPPPLPTEDPRGGMDPGMVFVVIWIVGLVARMLWIAAQLVHVRRLTRQAVPVVDDPRAISMSRVQQSFGIGRRVALLESARIAAPVTCGLWRPVVLVPEESRSWPEGRLRVVLLHELAHIRRADYLSGLFAELACALYWPIPLVWVARGAVQAEQEQASDDLVLTSGTAAVEYADHLLAIARTLRGAGRPIPATLGMARETGLKRRIRAILDGRVQRAPLRSSSAVAMLVALSGVALPIAALHPAAAAEEAGPPEPPLPWTGTSLVGWGAGGASASGEEVFWTEVMPGAGAAEVRGAGGGVGSFLSGPTGLVGWPLSRHETGAEVGYTPVARPQGAVEREPEYHWVDIIPGALAADAEFEFEVADAGRYLLWGRVMGQHGEANSLFLSIDGGPEMVWDTPRRSLGVEKGRWVWSAASARQDNGRDGDPLILDLAAGTHTVHLRPREKGTGLGGLLLTNDASYRPLGTPPGAPPVHIWFEPEHATPVRALTVRTGGGSTGDGYLEAAEHGPADRTPDEKGAATLTFELPHAGIFTLWARTMARRDDTNSFWIRVDDGAWVRWNGIPHGGDWRWSTVHDGDGDAESMQFALHAGEHRIEIARREGGTRIDRLVLTNQDRLPSGTATAE